MARARTASVASALLAAVPLLVVAGIVVRGALRPSRGPEVRAVEPSAAPLAGYAEPHADLSAERLHERVDGAEAYLRSQGCSRLLAWDLGDPAATLELFFFDDPEGAARVLARDAVPARTPGPGDEASADAQSVLFRRGRVYARLVADPDSPVDPGRLLAEAGLVDRAILDGLGRGM